MKVLSLRSAPPVLELFKVKLNEQADAMAALLAVVTNRIEAVPVTKNDAADLVLWGEHDAAAHTRLPAVLLFESGKVIHQRSGRFDAELKPTFPTEWEEVAGIEVKKAPGSDFLIIVTGQNQRKLGDQWKNSAEPPRAESVGIT